MNLQYRIDLLSRLGEYILSANEDWLAAKEKAAYENGWFIPEFIEISCQQIAQSFLQKKILEKWMAGWRLAGPGLNEGWSTGDSQPPKIGIVMAGNIPLVGFHDWLCVFISGHRALVKPSSRDRVLIEHLTTKIGEWDAEAGNMTAYSDLLKGCDAYIATGSNNSSRYFEYYFGKYPHIIRRNRTSVAVLDGSESGAEMEKLADDVHLYFGRGCRNVSKIYVPKNYDFQPLLESFKKYNWLVDHHKYKNNYDYNLALHLLNRKYYMSSGSLLLVEDPSVFSPISQLNYEYYADPGQIFGLLKKEPDLQCIVGRGQVPFGRAQAPALEEYADGINTLGFLAGI